ncbi:MAG: SDR family oxidoreductase [Chloroflexota bacterium]
MIVVAGGTGTLGTRLVTLLTDRGLDVRIMSRNPAKTRQLVGDRVELVPGDVRDPRAVEQAMVGARTVVSAITGFGPDRDLSPRTVDWEGNANLIRAAKLAGVEHFILISVRQAAPDHPIELFRMKYRAEEELRSSGLAWTIIRPTAYMETWVGVLGAPLLQNGTTTVFGRGENPMNFVSAQDVAGFADLAIADRAMWGATVEVGGPENPTMNEVVETFKRLTGASGKVGHVPLPVIRVISAVMRPFNPTMAGLAHASVVMDTTDMSFDASETRTRYPSIPVTHLADVVRKGYADPTPAPLLAGRARA